MANKIVVHTGASMSDPCPEETKALDRPGIEFHKRGPCHTPEELIAAAADADVTICRHEPYTREVFAQLPRLKAVIRTGVGVDTVDLDGATEFGVIVAHFPDFCTREVANHALVLLMCCAKKIVRLDHALRTEGWQAAVDLRWPMGAIHDQTLGLVAFGAIARAAAERARCLDMNVIAYDPFVGEKVFKEYGVESVTLDELAKRSDYVSCHLPLNAHTSGMLDGAFFSQMKRTAYFINTGRGAVVKEADLIAALQQGQIAGAGLDVFQSEPIRLDHPFLSMDNVVLTPHTASSATETFRVRDRRVGEAAVVLVEGGIPEFVANRQVLASRRR